MKAQRGSRGIAILLYSTSALDGVGGQRHVLAALSHEMTQHPLCRRLGWTHGWSPHNRVPNKHVKILWNNQQMSQCAVKFYFSASPLYMFRAAHTPIIRSTIFTVSTAIGTIHTVRNKICTALGFSPYPC